MNYAQAIIQIQQRFLLFYKKTSPNTFWTTDVKLNLIDIYWSLPETIWPNEQNCDEIENVVPFVDWTVSVKTIEGNIDEIFCSSFVIKFWWLYFVSSTSAGYWFIKRIIFALSPGFWFVPIELRLHEIWPLNTINNINSFDVRHNLRSLSFFFLFWSSKRSRLNTNYICWITKIFINQ